MSLLTDLSSLAPWSAQGDLSPSDWARYREVARSLQRTDPAEVARSLAEFLDGASPEDETRLFLLLRTAFDLPERAPAAERRVYKGWINWPPPGPNDTVDLSWPVTWSDGLPSLAAPYAGSEGPRYAAVEEYRHLLAHYPFRELDVAE